MSKGIEILINNRFIKIENLHKSCSWAIKNLKKTAKQNSVFSSPKFKNYEKL